MWEAGEHRSHRDLADVRAAVAEADDVARLARDLGAAPERAREQVRAALVDSREEGVIAHQNGGGASSCRGTWVIAPSGCSV
jgi:hypothetical protein